MQDGNRETTIAFNGEIYNYLGLKANLAAKGHSFRSQSDTEVLLAAYREWGTDCLSRLNGMFAFAIYDSRLERLFMARDRAGEKPLFYSLRADGIRFASELKGLMTDATFHRHVDLDALDCYLAMGFVPGERCILQSVKKLPPAHALSFDLASGDSRGWRYWHPPAFQSAATSRSGERTDLIDELELLLQEAVRRQLVADVPVGVLLSGGVDSSLVTAMAARATSKVKTFTVRFPGHGRYDETEYARLVARQFGTEHVELDAAESTPDLLAVLARQFDEPIADSSMIPTYLLSRLVREHCTVALGGDGGDELFGGYPYYSHLLTLQRVIGRIPHGLRRTMADAAEILLPVGFKGRNWLQGLDVDFHAGLPVRSSRFDRSTRLRLVGGQSANGLAAERIREQRIPGVADLVQRATRMDYENYLAEDILVKVDRTSMLNSLEVRSPFLDQELTEFAFGTVPSNLKVTSASCKILLRSLAARVLPPTFDQCRKQGFSIPLGSWLRSGPWLALFRDVLLGTESTLFDKTVVTQLFDGQTRGRANGERLFSLVMFELWRREYGISS